MLLVQLVRLSNGITAQDGCVGMYLNVFLSGSPKAFHKGLKSLAALGQVSCPPLCHSLLPAAPSPCLQCRLLRLHLGMNFPLLQHFQGRLFKSSAPVASGNLIFLCSNLFLNSIYHWVTRVCSLLLTGVLCFILPSAFFLTFSGNSMLCMSHSQFAISVLYSLHH